MVHEEHAAAGGGGGEAGGAVGRARVVGGAFVLEVVFEDEGEFVHEVGVLGGRFFERGDEGHQAGAVVDERLERGPCARDGGGRGRDVGQLVEARGGELRAELGGGGVVRVHDEDGDDFGRVRVHPGFYFLEPGDEGAGVEEVACAVAETPRIGPRGGAVLVDLGGEEADAGVQLDGRVVVLVAGGGEGGGAVAEEGGVVRAEVGDVVVGSAT